MRRYKAERYNWSVQDKYGEQETIKFGLTLPHKSLPCNNKLYQGATCSNRIQKII